MLAALLGAVAAATAAAHRERQPLAQHNAKAEPLGASMDGAMIMPRSDPAGGGGAPAHLQHPPRPQADVVRVPLLTPPHRAAGLP